MIALTCIDHQTTQLLCAAPPIHTIQHSVKTRTLVYDQLPGRRTASSIHQLLVQRGLTHLIETRLDEYVFYESTAMSRRKIGGRFYLAIAWDGSHPTGEVEEAQRYFSLRRQICLRLGIDFNFAALRPETLEVLSDLS